MDDHQRPAPAGARLQLGELLDLQSGYWAGGEPRSVEAILERCPGLRDDAEALLDLVYHEVLLRQQWGDTPSLAEYVARFPWLEDALKAHFEVHQALQGSTAIATVPSAPDRSAHSLPAVKNYEILGELGRGGTGVVYKARHLGLNRLVALKMLRAESLETPQERDRFRNESEAMARIEHPNVVRVYEVGEHEGRPYFAMELVTGGSLEQRLGGVPQPPARSARLAETLARAVHAAHALRLVHRDLKPANVLLAAVEGGDDPWGLPKVSDFGLAKRLDAGDHKTRSGDILGTPCYMAPEQAYGRNNAVGPRADIYALGAILYELLTGRPPFRGETVWDTLQQVGRQEVVPPRRLQPRVPRDLETICLKCLHKDPGRRYPDAAALADDLAGFLAGQPIKARPLPWWEQAWRSVRRRPTASACAGLVLALGAAHYAHLQAELSGARLGAAVAEVREALGRAEAACREEDWERAAALLRDAALPRLDATEADRPGEPQLAGLREQAGRLDDLVGRRLNLHDRLRTLAERRDDVGFFAAPYAGLEPAANRARARAAVEETLALFPGLPRAPGPDLPDAKGREAREGCCELLLDLAAVTAEPAPGESAQRRRENAEEALRLLDRAAAFDVDTPVLHDRRAACLERLGRADEAAAERSRARADLRRPFEWFLRGSDLLRAGDVRRAAEHFEAALAADPDHFGARYALGVCGARLGAVRPELRRGELLAAQVHFSYCIGRKPDRVWPYVQRGLVRGELNDFAGAEGDFARAERLLAGAADDVALYALLVNRGLVRVRAGAVEGAVADLTRAASLRPGEWQAYVNLAAAYTEQGKAAEAAAQLDRAAGLRPAQGLAAIHRSRARLHERSGEPAAAAEDLRRAAEAEPGAADADRAGDHAQRARLLEQAGRHEDAVAAAEECLRLQPDNAGALRARADALLHLRRFDEAVAALDRTLERVREREGASAAAAYRARAGARAQLGEHARAAEDFTRALGLRPEDTEALTGRGWAYVALEASVLAERDFDSAVRLEPRNAEALVGRAYARVKSGSEADGLRDAEAALRIGPREADLLCNAARVFARAARRSEGDPGRQGPAAWEERGRLEARALELLGEALAAMPADRRVSYWRQRIERDSALASLRNAPAYRQLAGNFTGPVSASH